MYIYIHNYIYIYKYIDSLQWIRNDGMTVPHKSHVRQYHLGCQFQFNSWWLASGITIHQPYHKLFEEVSTGQLTQFFHQVHHSRFSSQQFWFVFKSLQFWVHLNDEYNSLSNCFDDFPLVLCPFLRVNSRYFATAL